LRNLAPTKERKKERKKKKTLLVDEPAAQKHLKN